MRYTAEPAFVLHARAWRETSLLVEVLSAEHGRIGLVARGVQGPKRHVLRAALQPLQSITPLSPDLRPFRKPTPGIWPGHANRGTAHAASDRHDCLSTR